MKEFSIEEKAKAYDRLIERLKDFHFQYRFSPFSDVIAETFPELAESEGKRVRNKLIEFFKGYSPDEEWWGKITQEDILAWLEKQGEQKPVYHKFRVGDKVKKGYLTYTVEAVNEESYKLQAYSKDGDKGCTVFLTIGYEKDYELVEQKPCMIQWKGDNLKEVIDFTGKDKNFEKWFKSFEEYEKYVSDHNGIFKLFNEDGSHYEVPVGAWIVRTPNGYNIASKAVFKPAPIEWSEEDEKLINRIEGWLTTLCEYLKDENSFKCVADVKDVIDKLKSLRLQKWRPTEDQIMCLQDAISNYQHRGYKAETLESLYKQLKQL